MTFSLANFNSSCFVPAMENSTVVFVFSPEPSTFNTTPTPTRKCSTLSPTLSTGNGPEGVAEEGLGDVMPPWEVVGVGVTREGRTGVGFTCFTNVLP